MNEIFSEYFARRENLITRVDARIKVVFIAAAIAIVLSSASPTVPFFVTALVILSLFNIGIPFKIIIFRLSAPLGVAIAVLLVKTFFFHQSVTESLLIMSKIIGSTSFVLFLSMTTTLDKLLAACYWFKVPGVWVEICLITYRYIFVLLEDALILFDAQRVRLGYANLFSSLRSVGTLSGAIIIRAYDQSIATYEAMSLRGYKGNIQIPSSKNRLTKEDAIATLLFSVILVFLIVIDKFL